jgi:hypothetical protein
MVYIFSSQTPHSTGFWGRLVSIHLPPHHFFHLYIWMLWYMDVLSVFYHCDKVPEKSNLWEGRFILAHSVRVFSLLLSSCGEVQHHSGRSVWEEATHKWVARKQRVRTDLGTSRAYLQPPTSSNQIPLSSFHHLSIMSWNRNPSMN